MLQYTEITVIERQLAVAPATHGSVEFLMGQRYRSKGQGQGQTAWTEKMQLLANNHDPNNLMTNRVNKQESHLTRTMIQPRPSGRGYTRIEWVTPVGRSKSTTN